MNDKTAKTFELTDTASGRRGTSLSQTRRPFEIADPTWAECRIQSGLSSGEGLIWAVRDPMGFRPLCYALEGPLFDAASESVPLLNLGFREAHALEPGELILIQTNKFRKERSARGSPSVSVQSLGS